MPRDLRGLPIAITGASAGIGRATAVLCARAGMPVALSARRADRLDQVRLEIEREGGRVMVVAGDVQRPEDAVRLVERAIGEFGSLYAVFANAGYGLQGAVEAASDAELREIFEVNFWGTLHTVRAALPALRARGGGHVLICSSCVSKIGLPYFGAYCATKACQDHFGRALRHELRPAGIAVSTVHPVRTKTEFFDVADAKSGARRTPGMRAPDFTMQTADKVARAVLACLRRPRSEVWTSTLTRLLLAASVAMPGVTDFALGQHARRAQHGAE